MKINAFTLEDHTFIRYEAQASNQPVIYVMFFHKSPTEFLIQVLPNRDSPLCIYRVYNPWGGPQGRVEYRNFDSLVDAGEYGALQHRKWLASHADKASS